VRYWLCAVVLAAVAVGAGRDSAPRPLATKCGGNAGISASPFWLTAQDGVRLYAVESGTGSVGVVLAHESPSDLCGWLPYVVKLNAAGLRVLAFDFRDFGDSQRPSSTSDFLAYGRDLHAAVNRLRDDGAKHVFLIGASFGGAAALTFGPDLPLSGLISLSGEVALPGSHLNGLAAAARLRAPLLIVGSRHDRYLTIPDALRLLRRAGSKDKRTAFYPGAFHGWDIVEEAPYAAQARGLILAWIRARS
jgi:alpha-beta hydrolase superfamily lysophospholipase